jgi:hypothetical protein
MNLKNLLHIFRLKFHFLQFNVFFLVLKLVQHLCYGPILIANEKKRVLDPPGVGTTVHTFGNAAFDRTCMRTSSKLYCWYQRTFWKETLDV